MASRLVNCGSCSFILEVHLGIDCNILVATSWQYSHPKRLYRSIVPPADVMSRHITRHTPVSSVTHDSTSNKPNIPSAKPAPLSSFTSCVQLARLNVSCATFHRWCCEPCIAHNYDNRRKQYTMYCTLLIDAF